MHSVIGIDIDGVLADFAWSFTGLIAALYPGETRGLPIHCKDQPVWDIEDTPGTGITTEMVDRAWAMVARTPRFWAELSPIINPKETQRLAEVAEVHDVVAITSRHFLKAGSIYAETRWWLNEVGLEHVGLVVADQKERLVEPLFLRGLLDDKIETVKAVAWEMETLKVDRPHTFLMAREYNQAAALPVGAVRVRTVGEYLKEVLR